MGAKTQSGAAEMWVKLSDEILDNPKILAVGALGFQVYVAGLVYAARNLTDGFVPASRTRTLVDLSGVYVDRGNDPGLPIAESRRPKNGKVEAPNPAAIIHQLVHVGLWTRVTGGYRIHDYLAYNPSRSDILRQRENHANRQRRYVHRKSDAVRDVGADASGDPSPVPVPIKNILNPPTPLTDPPEPEGPRRVPTPEQTREYLRRFKEGES